MPEFRYKAIPKDHLRHGHENLDLSDEPNAGFQCLLQADMITRSCRSLILSTGFGLCASPVATTFEPYLQLSLPPKLKFHICLDCSLRRAGLDCEALRAEQRYASCGATDEEHNQIGTSRKTPNQHGWLCTLWMLWHRGQGSCRGSLYYT